MNFGSIIRQRRESLREADRRYSVRQVAQRIGVEPAYLSKVERGEQAPPSEATIGRLADELELDADVLLAMAGKVSSDLQAIIRQRLVSSAFAAKRKREAEFKKAVGAALDEALKIAGKAAEEIVKKGLESLA